MLRLIVFSGLTLAALSGCSKSKEQAVVAIDEANLTISSARKAGAQNLAYKTLKDAEGKLTKAEKSFKNGAYSTAKREAQSASETARQAKIEAETKKIGKTTKKKSK